MKRFYFDLAKICFGVGFYGCVTKVDDPLVAVFLGILSLVLTVMFAIKARNKTEVD